MADKDLGNDGPSLELPSFLGGRRKRNVPAHDTVVEPAHETVVETEPEPAREPEPEPVSEPSPEPKRKARRVALPDAQSDTQVIERVDESPEEPSPRRERKPRTLPAPTPGLAAAIAGLVTGLLLVCLTYLTMEGCSAARGTSSCGGSGFVALLLITVLVTWLASVLLRAWRVPEPGTTALLGVGLLAVVALLFLIDLLFEWWMIIVIPVVGLLTFVLSHAVGSTFGEERSTG